MSKKGRRFGRLVAVEETGRTSPHGDKEWFCQCDCGNSAFVWSGNLREHGGTRSCGCLREYSKAKLEHDFAEMISEKSAGFIEYVSGYEKKAHCVITARCRRCGHVFTRDKQGIYTRLSCPRCSKETRFIDRFNSRYGHAFEYAGGYECEGSTIIIRCRKCGETSTRKATKNLFEGNVCCHNCWNNRRGYEPSVCVLCNEPFMRFAEHQTMCSECHDRVLSERSKTSKRLREARARNNGEVDYSITLDKLLVRDNHTCQLCGAEVDESDYTYVGSTFVAGNSYPSIDHIVPLSKGGTHQWDNVQLAHRLCNSIKCDN